MWKDESTDNMIQLQDMNPKQETRKGLFSAQQPELVQVKTIEKQPLLQSPSNARGPVQQPTSSNKNRDAPKSNPVTQSKNQNGTPPPSKKESVMSSRNVPSQKGMIPTMPVKCNFCTLKQSVPGNAQLFVCNVCNQMTKCEPRYNLFICCSCTSKVCYPLNTSQFIKCSRCSVVNRVPVKAALTSQQSPASHLSPHRSDPVQNVAEQQKWQKIQDFKDLEDVVPSNKESVWESYQDFGQQQKAEVHSDDVIPEPAAQVILQEQQLKCPNYPLLDD